METQRTHARLQCMVSVDRDDIDDQIDIPRGPHVVSRHVRDQQSGGATAQENELVPQWPQALGHQSQHGQIRMAALPYRASHA